MAVLTTGNTYANNDQVTAATLNATVNAATFTSGAVDSATTQLSGGAIIVRDGGITAPKIANGAVTAGKYAAGSIVNADVSGSAAIADTKLATISTAGKVANSATTATNANTASAIVARDASGNFSAGMITANVTGNLTGTASAVADGAVTAAKLESGSNGQLFIGNGSGFQKSTLTAGSNITISNSAGGITIAAAGGGGGSVTSVDVSGGTTGLTTSGGPVTGSGTITLAGTLAIANGGTGATSAGAALTALGAYPATNPSGFTTNTGTIGGSTGSTDNRVLLADGTGGSTVKSSAVSVDGSGNVDGVANLTASGVFNTTSGAYRVSGTQVVGARAAAEANVAVTSGGSLSGMDTLSEISVVSAFNALENKINALLAKLRTHGLIDT
jgi:hypothetical protein